MLQATKTQKLNIIYLKRLISSRENYMLNSSLKTVEDLETYAENSVSPVYYLFLEAMGLYFFCNVYATCNKYYIHFFRLALISSVGQYLESNTLL